MNRLFALVLLGLTGFALPAPALSVVKELPIGEPTVLPVADAVKLLEGYLGRHPSDGTAWFRLGLIHVTAYACGMEAIEIDVPAADNDVAPGVEGEMPPMSYALRLVSVSKERVSHLAQAVRAFQAASTCDGGSARLTQLGLGYALYECRDRFAQDPWPLLGSTFDTEAKQFGHDARWWEDQALAILRPIALPEQRDESQIRPLAAWVMVQILKSRPANTVEVDRELVTQAAIALADWVAFRITLPLKEPLPAQPQDLEGLYPVTPASSAAAQVYLRAIDASLRTEDTYKDLPIAGQSQQVTYPRRPMAPEMIEGMETYVRFHAEAFRLLQEASAAPAVRYPTDLTKGFHVELPHLAPLHQLSRLLALKTLLAVEKSDHATVFSSVMENLALAKSLRQEPLVLSHLVHEAIVCISIEAMNDAQNHLEIPWADCAIFANELAALDTHDSHVVALKGERSSKLLALEELASTSRAPQADASEDVVQRTGNLPTANYARAAYDALIAAVDLPYPAAHAVFERIEKSDHAPIALSKILVGSLRMQALLRCARVALAVNGFALTHGALPGTLDPLVPEFLPEIPLDPFDDQPIRYRQSEDGFAVYSVGDNLVDDGGTVWRHSIVNIEYWSDVMYAVTYPLRETNAKKSGPEAPKSFWGAVADYVGGNR
jgi:hypothetical protein